MFSPTHKHRETRKKYQLLLVTNKHATLPGWEKQAVYVDEKNRKWSRPLSEFNLRFEKV